MGIFPEGEDSRSDHGLGRLVEFRFKGPPDTTSPISPLTSSGQRNCASWASQPQKSVTLLPCLGGKTTKSTRTCGALDKNKFANNYGNILDREISEINAELDVTV